jgi:hypothetical protein
MITESDEMGPSGIKDSYNILGGCNNNESDCFILSAYFNVSYTKEEVTNPKWWQFWKKPTVRYIEGCKRWETKSCSLYQWQVDSIGDLDMDNKTFQTMIFILGGGEQQFCYVQLERISSATPYIKTSGQSEPTP